MTRVRVGSGGRVCGGRGGVVPPGERLVVLVRTITDGSGLRIIRRADVMGGTSR